MNRGYSLKHLAFSMGAAKGASPIGSWILALGVVCAPAATWAAPASEVAVGPRAIALGGAYTALADDAWALFWNPAGLLLLENQEFASSQANQFGSGLRDNFASFALPLSADVASAVDWYHSGFEDSQLGFRENRVDFGAAFRLRPHVLIGLNSKLVTRSVDLDATNLSAGHGYGMDLGILVTPREHLRIGAVTQDLFNTRLRSAGDSPVLAYRRAFRIGAAYQWKGRAVATFDVDDRWHGGLEWSPIPAVAIRAGTARDWRATDGQTWSSGLGIKAGFIRVDWAREYHPTLAATDHFAAAFQFNFNPAQVRVEHVRIDEIYTSLSRTYAREPFGNLIVRNLQENPITAQIGVFVPQLMDAPSEFTQTLRPKAVTNVPLTAVLAERALALPGDRTVDVQVAVRYPSRRLARSERARTRTTAYSIGAIDWSLGTDQAAAFVTPRDPAIENVSRVAGRAAAGERERFGAGNLALIAAQVAAMAQWGITYVPDPNNPFASIADTRHAVDTIYYPFQTLERKSGDCDDTTVLLASLLASVGIETRLVDAPGHILLLAGSGLYERNLPGLGVDSAMVVIQDGQIWIPIETTIMSKGFMEAWRTGASEIARWASLDELKYVDVTDAQDRFEPIVLRSDRQPAQLDFAAVTGRLRVEGAAYATQREEYFRAHFALPPGTTAPSAEALSDIAHIHVLGGDWTTARKEIDKALVQQPGSVGLRNNLAIVLAGLDSLHQAEELLRETDESGQGEQDAIVRLNLGLVRCARGDSAEARIPLADGIARAGGYSKACALLQFSPIALDGPVREDSATGRFERLLRSLADETASTGTIKSLSTKRARARVRASEFARVPRWTDHLIWIQ